MHGVLVIQPKQKLRHRGLTPQEKANNRRISSARVRIEHVIGEVKPHRIIREIIRSSRSEFREKVIETCCGSHDFRIRLRCKEYSENQSEP